MDPDACLKEIRNLVAMHNEHIDPEMPCDCGHEIGDRFSMLDAWLSNGGFKPDDWGCTHNAK